MNEKIKAMIEKIIEEGKKKTAVIQVAPASRVAFGEIFGLPPGTDTTKKIITILKNLGFKYVVDTPFGADIITYAEALELKERLERGGPFPVMNSCCIGWLNYARKRHPELKEMIAKIVSPQMAMGAVIKRVISKKLGKKPEDMLSVSLMPCTLKRMETTERDDEGIRYVDYVITTRELGEYIRERGIDINGVKESEFDFFGPGTREGAIFGATGGITEAILTTLAYLMNEKKEITEFRNEKRIKKKRIKIGKYEIDVASVYGLGSAEKIIKEIKEGAQYHFIEIMACVGGCVGGPGQPLPFSMEKVKKRAEGMRRYAEKQKEKFIPEKNEVKEVLKKIEEKIKKDRFISF